MVQMLAAKPYQSAIPVIFNVEGAVGASPALNKPEDVVLVKAFLRKLGDTPGPRLDAATIAACKAVQVSSTPDPTLITAIKAFQTNLKKKDPNIVVDGRVSPAKEGYSYHAGTPWSIVQLNYDMKAEERFGAVWPCVHLASNCHPLLQGVAKKAIYGSDG
jgi:hypothetical protein